MAPKKKGTTRERKPRRIKDTSKDPRVSAVPPVDDIDPTDPADAVTLDNLRPVTVSPTDEEQLPADYSPTIVDSFPAIAPVSSIPDETTFADDAMIAVEDIPLHQKGVALVPDQGSVSEADDDLNELLSGTDGDVTMQGEDDLDLGPSMTKAELWNDVLSDIGEQWAPDVDGNYYFYSITEHEVLVVLNDRLSDDDTAHVAARVVTEPRKGTVVEVPIDFFRPNSTKLSFYNPDRESKELNGVIQGSISMLRTLSFAFDQISLNPREIEVGRLKTVLNILKNKRDELNAFIEKPGHEFTIQRLQRLKELMESEIRGLGDILELVQPELRQDKAVGLFTPTDEGKKQFEKMQKLYHGIAVAYPQFLDGSLSIDDANFESDHSQFLSLRTNLEGFRNLAEETSLSRWLSLLGTVMDTMRCIQDYSVPPVEQLDETLKKHLLSVLELTNELQQSIAKIYQIQPEAVPQVVDTEVPVSQVQGVDESVPAPQEKVEAPEVVVAPLVEVEDSEDTLGALTDLLGSAENYIKELDEATIAVPGATTEPVAAPLPEAVITEPAPTAEPTSTVEPTPEPLTPFEQFMETEWPPFGNDHILAFNNQLYRVATPQEKAVTNKKKNKPAQDTVHLVALFPDTRKRTLNVSQDQIMRNRGLYVLYSPERNATDKSQLDPLIARIDQVLDSAYAILENDKHDLIVPTDIMAVTPHHIREVGAALRALKNKYKELVSANPFLRLEFDQLVGDIDVFEHEFPLFLVAFADAKEVIDGTVPLDAEAYVHMQDYAAQLERIYTFMIKDVPKINEEVGDFIFAIQKNSEFNRDKIVGALQLIRDDVESAPLPDQIKSILFKQVALLSLAAERIPSHYGVPSDRQILFSSDLHFQYRKLEVLCNMLASKVWAQTNPATTQPRIAPDAAVAPAPAPTSTPTPAPPSEPAAPVPSLSKPKPSPLTSAQHAALLQSWLNDELGIPDERKSSGRDIHVPSAKVRTAVDQQAITQPSLRPVSVEAALPPSFRAGREYENEQGTIFVRIIAVAGDTVSSMVHRRGKPPVQFCYTQDEMREWMWKNDFNVE